MCIIEIVFGTLAAAIGVAVTSVGLAVGAVGAALGVVAAAIAPTLAVAFGAIVAALGLAIGVVKCTLIVTVLALGFALLVAAGIVCIPLALPAIGISACTDYDEKRGDKLQKHKKSIVNKVKEMMSIAKKKIGRHLAISCSYTYYSSKTYTGKENDDGVSENESGSKSTE